MPAEISRANLRLALARKPRKRTILRNAKDRWGRGYTFWIDKESLSPSGLIERRFSAPVEIPNTFLRYSEDAPWRMDYDLVGYVRYLKQARLEWEIVAREAMKKLYQEKGVDAPYTARALELAGPPPQDWRLVSLLARGDAWCLGFQKARTPVVVALIGEEKVTPRTVRQKAEAEFKLDPELEAMMSRSGTVGERLYPDEIDERDRLEYLATREKTGGLSRDEGIEDEEADLVGDDSDELTDRKEEGGPVLDSDYGDEEDEGDLTEEELKALDDGGDELIEVAGDLVAQVAADMGGVRPVGRRRKGK